MSSTVNSKKYEIISTKKSWVESRSGHSKASVTNKLRIRTRHNAEESRFSSSQLTDIVDEITPFHDVQGPQTSQFKLNISMNNTTKLENEIFENVTLNI